ncbi:MAG: hypothetical protein JJE52_01560 [Acidimicrobiia bacterium]|nr:hypothetical protein [Acidimicrobiia bacterium]
MSTFPPPPPPSAPEPPTGGPRPWFKKKRVLIPAAIVAVFVVVGITADPAKDDPDTTARNTIAAAPTESTVHDAADEPDAVVAVKPEAEETPSTTTSAPEPTPASGTREAPLPMAEVAAVGEDYEATVVSFTPDATAEVVGANMFNDPPPEGEVYSLVRVRATYTGDNEGTPGTDLSVGYIGADGRVYVDHDCGAVEPSSMSDEPRVVAGGMVEGNFCLRLPAAVLGTGSVFIEPLFSFSGDEKVWWAAS